MTLIFCPQVEDGKSSTPVYWAVVKGAPEVIQGFLAAPPAEYEAAYKVYAAQGGRCVLCAPRSSLHMHGDLSVDPSFYPICF